jgi:hypothetical protein
VGESGVLAPTQPTAPKNEPAEVLPPAKRRAHEAGQSGAEARAPGRRQQTTDQRTMRYHSSAVSSPMAAHCGVTEAQGLPARRRVSASASAVDARSVDPCTNDTTAGLATTWGEGVGGREQGVGRGGFGLAAAWRWCQAAGVAGEKGALQAPLAPATASAHRGAHAREASSKRGEGGSLGPFPARMGGGSRGARGRTCGRLPARASSPKVRAAVGRMVPASAMKNSS